MPGNGLNINNYIPVVMMAFHDGAEGLKGRTTLNWIKMGIANVRFIQSKELLIDDFIQENDLDLFLVTET